MDAVWLADSQSVKALLEGEHLPVGSPFLLSMQVTALGKPNPRGLWTVMVPVLVEIVVEPRPSATSLVCAAHTLPMKNLWISVLPPLRGGPALWPLLVLGPLDLLLLRAEQV